MDVRTKYWLSGLLEGEASFISQNEKYPACISLQMTDEDIVEKLASLWDVSYCKVIPKEKKA